MVYNPNQPKEAFMDLINVLQEEGILSLSAHQQAVFEADKRVEFPKPCAIVCVLENGRQHTIVATKIIGNIVIGRIADQAFVALYQPERGNRAVLLADHADNINREIRMPGRSVLFTGECFTLTPHRMAIDITTISLIELPSGPVIDYSIRLPGGHLDEIRVLEAFPDLNRFHLPNGGFAENPSAVKPIGDEEIADPALVPLVTETPSFGGDKTFVYTALNAQGQEISGNVSANNQAEAISKVRQQGVFPTMVKQGTPIMKKVPLADKFVKPFKPE